jgi:hypothetical protein
MEERHRVGQDQDGPGSFPDHRRERILHLLGTSQLHGLELYCQRSGGRLGPLDGERVPRIMGIPQDGDSQSPGDRLLEELDLLDAQVRTQGGGSGDVSARSPEAGDKAQLNRVRSVHHDDRDRRGRSLGGKGGRRVERDDHVDLEAHELGREVTVPLRLPLWIARLDGKVLPFDVPRFAQALPQELR